MRAKIKLATALLCLPFVFAGCGGGGSSENLSSTSYLTGTVEASKVAGVEVCINGTDTCVKSASDGTFKLPISSLPVTLVLKVGDLPLGTVNASSTAVSVNPLTLAGGNATVAQAVGAVIHAMANDTTGSEEVIDLSNVGSVIVNSATDNGTLVDCIKESLESGENATLEVDGHEVEVAVDNGVPVVKVDNQTVDYTDMFNLYQNMWQIENMLSYMDGRKVKFDDGAICNVKVEPNPDDFVVKLSDCDKSGEYHIRLDEVQKQVVAVNKDGKEYPLSYSSVANAICYYDKEENSTECFSLYSPEVEESLLQELAILMAKANGKEVSFSDSEDNDTCTVVADPFDVTRFMFVNCGNSNNTDDTFERIYEDNGTVYVTDEDGATCKITAVDLEKGEFFYSCENDTGSWINGTAKVDFSNETLSAAALDKFSNVLNLIKMFNGKQITFAETNGTDNWVETCDLIKKDDNVFELTNCSNSTDDGEYFVSFSPDGEVILVNKNDYEDVTYVDSVNATNSYMTYHYLLDDRIEVNGTIIEVTDAMKPIAPEVSLEDVERFLESHNGTPIYFLENATSVENCTLTYNGTGIQLSNCTNPDDDYNATLSYNDTGVFLTESNGTVDKIIGVTDNALCIDSPDDGIICFTDYDPLNNSTLDASELEGKYYVGYTSTNGDGVLSPEYCFELKDGEILYPTINGIEVLGNYVIDGNKIEVENQTSDVDIIVLDTKLDDAYVALEQTDNDTNMYLYKAISSEEDCIAINAMNP
ncbi:hypothetical protein SAMN06265339_1666 [Desulfurobacterium pacificum]|uniref:Uncharacterized protein n=1 Tax=Desulfurobacterium pacificum TaxID=240166 RepID=A0ABY1NV38_9BACT|nr:hypothetical protein [Desulfurobacterium pacificum]SMP19045.1 hypothetical protein SAMN06265339_1666 [Desulfurobacterium pacificum]